MKIITTILIILFILSCNSEQECEIIRDKDEVNGNYYFYFRSNFLPNSQANNIGGTGFASQYASGKVSKEEYDKYAVGDEYCF